MWRNKEGYQMYNICDFEVDRYMHSIYINMYVKFEDASWNVEKLMAYMWKTYGYPTRNIHMMTCIFELALVMINPLGEAKGQNHICKWRRWWVTVLTETQTDSFENISSVAITFGKDNVSHVRPCRPTRH